MPINYEALEVCEKGGKGHIYTFPSTGKPDIILCDRCGRIKVVKEGDGWKVLH